MIDYALNGAVATLTLNRPDKRNAMTVEMWRELARLMATAADQARVIVIHGAGAHFCAGADVSEFDTVLASRDAANRYFDAIESAIEAVATCPVPTLAALRGQAYGGGYAIALACDVRLAAADVQIAITPAKLGLVYPHGDLQRLRALTGAGVAHDLLFTGRAVGADEALRLRLVEHIHDDLDAAVAAWAATVAELSARSHRSHKQMLSNICEAQDRRALLLDAVADPDFTARRAAFTRRKTP